MLDGLVVADDLTGACDTGHEFATRGYGTQVSLDPAGDHGGADVLVVDTDSRYARAEAAADAVRAAVGAHSAATVYKKVDSTLRGNLVAEVEAAIRARVNGSSAGSAAGGGLAVVAPASPATGRTTACGVHLVEGTLVTDTPPGQDPEKGPVSAHIPDLFANADVPVEHLGVGTVATGTGAVADRLQERAGQPRVVTADATHEQHLDIIATGADRLDEPVVYAGSAGLAGHVPLPTEATGRDHPPTPSPSESREGVLGVAGSVAPQTLAALDALPGRVLVVVDAEGAVTDPAGTAARAAIRVETALEGKDRVVVTAATDEAAVDRALDAGRRAGVTERESRERVAETLARTAREAVTEARPAGLFLTGGDTALAVLESLGTEAIALSGESVGAGIPLGMLRGGSADGSALVTKAGAFGTRETVINCLDRLQEI